MVTDDKSRQQSAYIPQSGSQQGSGQATTQPQRYEGRWLTPRRGAAADPFDYAPYGGSPFRLMRRLNDDLDRLFSATATAPFSCAASALRHAVDGSDVTTPSNRLAGSRSPGP